MGTLVLYRDPDARWPLIAAGNRDEMRNRPWQQPARHWPDRPHVLGALDEREGGSWFALNDQGVVAVVLTRHGFLPRLDDKRSRGLLALDALEYGDAHEAVEAMQHADPYRYQPFNLLIADAEAAFWLKHAGPDAVETERNRIRVQGIESGVHILATGNLNDATDPRVRHFLPRFARTAAPDPDTDAWKAWTELLAEGPPDHAADPREGMAFDEGTGFATGCSSLLAIPHPEADITQPVLHATKGPPWRFRFRAVDLSPPPSAEPVDDTASLEGPE